MDDTAGFDAEPVGDRPTPAGSDSERRTVSDGSDGTADGPLAATVAGPGFDRPEPAGVGRSPTGSASKPAVSSIAGTPGPSNDDRMRWPATWDSIGRDAAEEPTDLQFIEPRTLMITRRDLTGIVPARDGVGQGSSTARHGPGTVRGLVGASAPGSHATAGIPSPKSPRTSAGDRWPWRSISQCRSSHPQRPFTPRALSPGASGPRPSRSHRGLPRPAAGRPG